ncbi:MAG: sulfurtransferase TusA family protein [Pseudomonadota bacterium]|nr:sulfurtransferase TusA family protein [Pseudomonadota bacterium]
MTEADGTMYLDAKGLTCPLPVLRLQKALRELGAGACLCLHATDPMSEIDVPHFVDEHGHVLVDMQTKTGAGPGGMTVFEFVIRKN